MDVSVADKREVYAYLRVSTQGQNSGLLSQQHAVQRYCKINGIENYKIYQDVNVSGAKESRPALDEMMKNISEGKCKHLIVFAFSRFSRSCSHLLKSLEFLQSNNCRFSSVSEQIDTSSIIGKTLLAVLGALAQMERELIVQRVKAGLARAKAEGKHIGRVKTRPSEMIRKVLMRGVTYREAAHLCKTSQGSVCLEAKEIRNEFRGGQLPEFLTVEDVMQSAFFAGEKPDLLTQVIANAKKEKLNAQSTDENSNSEDHEPVGEVQPIPTIMHKTTK